MFDILLNYSSDYLHASILVQGWICWTILAVYSYYRTLLFFRLSYCSYVICTRWWLVIIFQYLFSIHAWEYVYASCSLVAFRRIMLILPFQRILWRVVYYCGVFVSSSFFGGWPTKGSTEANSESWHTHTHTNISHWQTWRRRAPQSCHCARPTYSLAII